MVEIKTPKGETILVSDEDKDLAKVSWQLNSVGYARRTVRKKGGKSGTLLMHRFIMNPSKGFVVDHINGNKLDNRRENLRVCTLSQNQQRSTDKKKTKMYSKYRGVTKDKRSNLFQASIMSNGEVTTKYFKNEVEAGEWRNEQAKELHGEFAVLSDI